MAAIMMTDADRARWIPILQKHYEDQGKTPIESEEIINDILATCQMGWNRSPRDLDTRIKMKSGFQWKSHNNLKPKKAKQAEDEADITDIEDDDDTGDAYLFKTMSKGERGWWESRLTFYGSDFDFNTSSDAPLLRQLLVEELIQRRLQRSQLASPNSDLSKRMTESLRRITDCQTKLGITREQRAGMLDNIDGNVAELALKLDAKLKDMPDILQKELEDELYFYNRSKQREPINVLPPSEKLEALLQVGGKTTANLDSDRISEITEQVAIEIKDKKDDQEAVKLPDGIDMSK